MKSIFLQPVNECKKCLIVRNTDGRSGMHYNPGQSYICEGEIYTHCTHTEKIYETDLNLPLLEEGEDFYIAEIEKVVTINKRMRSSDDSVIYEIESRNEIVGSELDFSEIRKELNKIYEKNDKYERLIKEVKKRWNGKSILRASGIEGDEELWEDF